MKNYYLYSFIILALASCTGKDDKSKIAAVDPIIEKKCYLAIDGSDSAFLNLDMLKSGKIKGDLLINYKDAPKNAGEIAGVKKGDTLFLDYTFKAGKSKIINKNPLAFLSKDDTLLMGVGVIETTMGRSYFVKDKPINFEKGRFKFEIKTCER